MEIQLLVVDGFVWCCTGHCCDSRLSIGGNNAIRYDTRVRRISLRWAYNNYEIIVDIFFECSSGYYSLWWYPLCWVMSVPSGLFWEWCHRILALLACMCAEGGINTPETSLSESDSSSPPFPLPWLPDSCRRRSLAATKISSNAALRYFSDSA